ncbi:MAG: hypothetical protein J6L00_01675, partial [Clostridia bacterium]|nr:hypothetical protein [Clostridia bacterium]
MKVRKRWKSAVALMLTLSLLVGMVSVCGSLLATVAVEGEQPIRFTADFTELQSILEQNGLGSTYNCGSDAYQTAYTAKGDVSTADGQLNTWMGDRFASKTSYTATSTRAWFTQGDFLLQGTDTYNGNSHFSVSGGMLRHQLAGGSGVGEMLRRVNTLIPQYKGTNVRLKNFEAKLTFKLGMSNFKGGFVFNFHETDPGAFVTTTGFTHKHTGNTLVIGNGVGHGALGKDGWAFHDYDANDPYISATTVDTATNKANDVAVADGVRFDRTLDDQLYMLTVRVVNGKANFTLESADGTFRQTLENKTFATTDGYLSFGVSNRDTRFSKLEITELDANGNVVDFGTYHDSVVGVEVFEETFSDLPDLRWNGSAYTYDSAYTSYSNVNGTASLTSTATYTVDVKSAALVDRLERKFDFYTYGYNGGGTMEMWNAAGYVVDADGNPLGAGFMNSGYKPATGEAASGYLPGSGQGGHGSHGMYPTMVLSENKWLHIAKDIDGTAKDPFDVVYSYVLNDANGDKAVLKNFQLDLDFKLTTASATSFPQNQSPVFVKFGGYDNVQHGDTDGAMFSISCNGEYFLDDLNTPVNGSTFTATKDTDKAPYYTETAGVAIREAHLTLTVKNGTVRAVVTLADGTTALDVTKDDIAIQNGLIYIGTTYAGIRHGLPYFGAVKVVRLDDNGDPIDFTSGDSDAFTASFAGLTDMIDGKYYRNNGNKGKAITLGKVSKENAWLSNGKAGQYAFDANDTAIVNYLSERFDFYHTDLTGTTTKMATPYTGSEEIQADRFVPGNVHWELQSGRWLRCYFGRAGNNELFRKYMTILPKEDGNVIYAADFEASFDIAQHSAGNTASSKTGGAIAFTFRSKQVAKLRNAATTYADATTLIFTRNELVIYDGVTADYKWSDLENSANRIAWTGGSVGTARVTLKVVKNRMDLKVTSLDGKTVYYEVTNKELTHDDAAGYMYFTMLNSDGALADISIKP